MKETASSVSRLLPHAWARSASPSAVRQSSSYFWLISFSERGEGQSLHTVGKRQDVCCLMGSAYRRLSKHRINVACFPVRCSAVLVIYSFVAEDHSSYLTLWHCSSIHLCTGGNECVHVYTCGKYSPRSGGHTAGAHLPTQLFVQPHAESSDPSPFHSKAGPLQSEVDEAEITCHNM